MFEKAERAGAETPWGQPWSELLAGLRPTAAEDDKYRAIVARVDDALRFGGVEGAQVVAGGAFGKGTHSRGGAGAGETLVMYAVFERRFHASDYFEAHLRPLFAAVKAARESAFVNVEDRGFAVEFVADGVECRLFAAGVMYGGAKDLVLESPGKKVANGSQTQVAVDEREVHMETSAGVMRVEFIRSQCPMYKDMVRVGKKWRDGSQFMVSGGRPGDYLVELLMVEAFHGAPAGAPSADVYAAIFRRFLALLATQSSSGSDVVAGDQMPKSFLTFSHHYSRCLVDHCLAKGLLKMDSSRSGGVDGSALVVVDAAVPFVNVAATVTEWAELRAAARDSLASFQNVEMVEILDARLKNFSESVEKTLSSLQTKLVTLEEAERAPRRWSGNVQFRDVHLSSDGWSAVVEMELRCLKWILHARRPRMESTGYHQCVDVSLQAVGDITRQLDVDVSFRGAVVQLKFDDKTDHVLVVRRSEVMRNRDYQLQITIVS